jgi:hypothetical protein
MGGKLGQSERSRNENLRIFDQYVPTYLCPVTYMLYSTSSNREFDPSHKAAAIMNAPTYMGLDMPRCSYKTPPISLFWPNNASFAGKRGNEEEKNGRH